MVMIVREIPCFSGLGTLAIYTTCIESSPNFVVGMLLGHIIIAKACT